MGNNYIHIGFTMTTLIPKFDLKDGGSTPAGAINRPINEKLEEWISVKDFGAIGDGTTNDTSAVQAALTAVQTTGGTLYFPTGTYLIDSLGVTSSNVTLRGAGMFKSILLNSQTTGLSFVYIQASNVEVCDLQIDGAFANQSANTGTALILALNPTTGKAQNISVHDCLVKAAGFDAIGAFNIIRSKIQNNIVYGYFDSGIDIVDGCTDVLVDGNSIINTGKYGIYVETNDNVTYNNNNNIVINGNTITQLAAPSGTGIGIGIGNHVDNIQISNNAVSLEYAGTFGIKSILTGESIVISGNVIRGNTGGPASTTGIYVENISTYSAKNATIIGNSVYLCAVGIEVYKISNVTVVGNVLNSTASLNCVTDGVNIVVTVSQNVFTGTVSFSGYTATSFGYLNNNIGTYSLTNNTGWTLYIAGARPTITYNDGSIQYTTNILKSGITSARPSTNVQTGDMYFDTTLNKPIWRNTANSGWVDATGTGV